MKKLNVTVVVFISTLVLFSACNEQVEVAPDEFEFVSVAIPDHLKTDSSNGRISKDEMDVQEVEVEITTKEGKKVKGIVRVTMPKGDEETLINFEVSSNILEETGADADFWIDGLETSNARMLGIGACLKNCGHEDVDNPGWCKVGCWAELALKVVVVVVAVT